ncbi:hypothetical protein D3C79_863700 [compost metagenome]
MEHIMDEAEHPLTVRGHGAVHGLGRVEETGPGQFGRGLAQLYFVERLILLPIRAPLLQIALLQLANRNQCLCNCHGEPLSMWEWSENRCIYSDRMA